MVNYESLLLGGKAKKAKSPEKCDTMGSGMTYEQRCANLAKGRATRMANLKKKKSGGGQYNQDYVDESQQNYRGSPLDLYYNIPEKTIKDVREQRGENTGGRMKKGGEMGADELLEMGKTGGRMKKGKGLEKEMSFMKNSNHTGMSMPTEAQFKRGGAMKGTHMEKMEEFQNDLHGAIKNLALLAEKFNIRLMK